MYILGVSLSHDSSSCLLRDGDIVFYQEDERFSKVKHNVTNNNPPVPFTYYQSELIKKYTNFIDNIIFCGYGDSAKDLKIFPKILNKLKNDGIEYNNVYYNKYEHHLYHAGTAAFSSGFEECACLIIDGMGSLLELDEDMEKYREIESIYSFNYKNGIKNKFKHYSKLSTGSYSESFEKCNVRDYQLVLSDSIGCGGLFNNFSERMGFDSGHDAGKIMGLSSYGLQSNSYGDWFFNFDGVELSNNNLIGILLKTLPTFEFQKQCDILKTLQDQTKKHTIHLIKKALELCETKNIVLSGGYFLNCVNNYQYLKEFPDVNFYIDPICHDGGTSIGASKQLWWNLTKDPTIRKLDSLYLGEQL